MYNSPLTVFASHLSVAACGQTFSPSPPSPAPADPPPELSSQSVQPRAPAASPSELRRLQSARDHLAGGTQHMKMIWLEYYFWHKVATWKLIDIPAAASDNKN